MSAKRSANSELNADNWDNEEESEEAGTFQKASEDVLKRRVVKAARRRLTGNEASTSTKSAFGSFAGFKPSSSTTSSAASSGAGLFSFLAKPSATTTTSTATTFTTPTTKPSLFFNKPPTTNGSVTKISENGLGAASTTTTSSSSSSSSSSSLLSKNTPSENPRAADKAAAVSTATATSDSSAKKAPEYYAKLKGLNQSVAQWIKTHVDANPVCILTPIFRDYEKYIREIEVKYGRGGGGGADASTKQRAESDGKAEEEEEEEEENNPDDTVLLAKSTSSGSLAGWKPERSVFGNQAATASIFSSASSTVDKGDSSKSPFLATSTVVSTSPFAAKPSATATSEVKSGIFSAAAAAAAAASESKKDEEQKKPPAAPVLAFGQSAAAAAATFSFGQSAVTGAAAPPASAQFSFGGGKPFTFGGVTAPTPSSEDKPATNENNAEEEDEEPPKPDFKPATEEGSIYEQKCKVFVKKDGNFSDRGVGTLFLKPTPSSKTQLIVRAGNSLGNLLLNTLLSDGIPIKRLNKTNIMLVCLPMPTAEPPPVATLLRVKTPEEADRLFEALEKHKK